MQTRRGCDEMGTYLRRVVDYLRGPAFYAEVAKAPEDRGGAAAAAEEAADWYGWFLFDRPAEGDCTPLRRYVDDHPELPARIRSNLLACEHSLQSIFRVVEVGEDSGVVLDLQGDDGDYYRVVGVGDLQLEAETLVSGRLVRWDGDHYFHGRVEPWPRAPRDLLAPSLEPYDDGQQMPGAGLDGLVMTRRRWLRERRLRP